ncbi:12171_t:CDS:2 [Funneliformis caledonium]|uniref:12171_t:CDS:1 n=1 Tax=Funneliformis caledonium TaxID=1117310 RepID=A0A9N9D3D7_9GLOM|nr:12171_t:CDS:2 [Funneliformis caledonium]
MNIPSVPHCLFIPITIGFLQTNLYYETSNTPDEFLPYQPQDTIVNTPSSEIKWNDNKRKEILKALAKKQEGIGDVTIKKKLWKHASILVSDEKNIYSPKQCATK